MNRRTRQWLVATAFGLSAVLNASPPVSATTKYPTAMPISATNQEIHDQAVNAVLRGRYIEALQGFDDVLKKEPSNASAYYNRGNVRYFRRDFLLALQDYSAALKYRPGFAAATMNRGIVLSILDRLDEALTDLDTAAELDPSNPDVFFNRAVVYVKRGAMEKALADYDRLVQLDGLNPDLDATRLRLNALLTRIDELGLVGRERNRSIIKEMDHARSVEQLLDFTDRTCIRLGDDSHGLSTLALASGWSRITDDKLRELSTPAIKLTSGWTLTNRLGSVAVVQTQSAKASSRQSCSITARLGDAHWFEDFATLFSSRFQAPRLVISELENRRESQQVVIRDDQARVEVTLIQTIDSKMLTVRTVHDKKQDIDPPNFP